MGPLAVVSCKSHHCFMTSHPVVDTISQNDGSKSDASARATKEFVAWPYSWFKNSAYQSRGSVSGTLKLSDGRPAAGAAVFLGDNHPNKTALAMGSDYYYTGYADSSGRFKFNNVRTGFYGLQAWSNGSAIADVAASYLKNDVQVKKNGALNLGSLTWAISTTRKRLFQVGDFDRKDLGFQYGGAPYQHALVAKCPANINYTVGVSQTPDWCFGQTYLGTWSINFQVDSLARANKTATLTVSLAGYSSGSSSNILLNNGSKIGNLTSGAVGQNATVGLASDPSLYRSATTAGEWRFFQFDFDGSLLKQGSNSISFAMTRNTTWHGFMWDSILLDW